jgi:hypothetical protein
MIAPAVVINKSPVATPALAANALVSYVTKSSTINLCIIVLNFNLCFAGVPVFVSSIMSAN